MSRTKQGGCPVCDCCGEEIGEGEACYDMPDGWTVCAEGDCLSEWAKPYLRRVPRDEEEER